MFSLAKGQPFGLRWISSLAQTAIIPRDTTCTRGQGPGCMDTLTRACSKLPPLQLLVPKGQPWSIPAGMLNFQFSGINQRKQAKHLFNNSLGPRSPASWCPCRHTPVAVPSLWCTLRLVTPRLSALESLAMKVGGRCHPGYRRSSKRSLPLLFA